jgi:hypothetical protein
MFMLLQIALLTEARLAGGGGGGFFKFFAYK